jgi:hypothetical protein
MREIEVRHLPAARGRKMLIQLNKPGLEALVEIVVSYWLHMVRLATCLHARVRA